MYIGYLYKSIYSLLHENVLLWVKTDTDMLNNILNNLYVLGDIECYNIKAALGNL